MGAGEGHRLASATLLPGLPCGSALPARLGSKHPARGVEMGARCLGSLGNP